VRPGRLALFILFAALLSPACSEISTPKSEPLIVQTAPPAKQEFRWSNGKMPKSFDPALAAAAPETDIVRALFEGLTDIDPRTLREKPAVAEKWTASEDLKTWTFFLRSDAKWSNGEPVTAHDFVRSWTRLAKMGAGVPHRTLFYNIEGLRGLGISPATAETPDFLSGSGQRSNVPFPSLKPEEKTPPPPANSAAGQMQPETNANSASPTSTVPTVEVLSGVTAESDLVLSVRLITPDKDFAKLVASPMFRPTFIEMPGPAGEAPDSNIVTNGAFRMAGIGPEGITLVRSDTYWNRDAVKLDKVLFVPKDSAEKALESYRNGELDAVTNAEFAPLALKLLSPYDDFRQTTHSALNYYEINIKKPPFSDERVRRALAMAIERDVLTEGELEGSTRPALSFLPFNKQPKIKVPEDRDLARDLLEKAGFPDGVNFPVIRLVVNRNDLQMRIARLVAKMWKQNLNLDTEIVVVGLAEVETARATGDYDLIRRGAVFPSNDEVMSLRSIFSPADEIKPEPGDAAGRVDKANAEPAEQRTGGTDQTEGQADASLEIRSEQDAVAQIYAIPLYFPTSYSLVKPYVSGFDFNSLDAPSLKDVSIDNGWQPK
jgi:oligopeptide transport system substrate-binding protein